MFYYSINDCTQDCSYVSCMFLCKDYHTAIKTILKKDVQEGVQYLNA